MFTVCALAHSYLHLLSSHQTAASSSWNCERSNNTLSTCCDPLSLRLPTNNVTPSCSSSLILFNDSESKYLSQVKNAKGRDEHKVIQNMKYLDYATHRASFTLCLPLSPVDAASKNLPPVVIVVVVVLPVCVDEAVGTPSPVMSGTERFLTCGEAGICVV